MPGATGMVLLVEDLTEMQLLEAELTHSERLASVGRLAAGGGTVTWLNRVLGGLFVTLGVRLALAER